MRRAIMQSTSVCVSLSINVIATNGQDTRLMTYPVFYLTGLIMALLSFGNWINRIDYQVSDLALECLHNLQTFSKVLAIGFNSLAFGIGVRL